MFKRYLLMSVFIVLILALAVGLPVNAVLGPSFVDPTARIFHPANLHLGELNYVAPFATLRAGPNAQRAIHMGNETDVQDSGTLDARNGSIELGEQVIIAHGATVKGPASIGEEGICPDGGAVCPSFVGFNAEVDGAIIEKDAMVSTLARVAPGVRIPSGFRVLPGKNVVSQIEVATETTPVTEADREFMQGVIEVNVAFAVEYAQLAAESFSNVHGINYDPGNTEFNPYRDLPILDGKPVRNPSFRNRIIGDVRLADDEDQLEEVMGANISLRADEGEPFEVGTIASMGNRTTFHALEHTQLQLGNNGRYGLRSIVHGGPDPFNPTTTGDNVRLRSQAVLFRSRLGDNCIVGFKSLVQGSDLPAGTVVPARTVMINNVVVGNVEW